MPCLSSICSSKYREQAKAMKTNQKKATFTLSIFLICILITGKAQSTTIQWDPVEVSDLEGYIIHCGTESGAYSVTYDVGNVAQYAMPGLETGCTYYFSVTSYDAWGNESGFSPEIEYRVSGSSDDTTPPELTEVVLLSSSRLQLVFNEPVCSQSVQTTSNYSIYPGITVMDAVLEEDETTVTLTTSCHSSGNYLITVSNILDRAETPNIIPDNTSLGYTFDATAVAGGMNNLPSEFSLSQNFPNPFNPRTTIEYSVKEPGYVRIQIYNIRGELVKNLVDRKISTSGQQAPVSWDATNDWGMQVASGFYIYRLESGGKITTRRMQLVR